MYSPLWSQNPHDPKMSSCHALFSTRSLFWLSESALHSLLLPEASLWASHILKITEALTFPSKLSLYPAEKCLVSSPLIARSNTSEKRKVRDAFL